LIEYAIKHKKIIYFLNVSNFFFEQKYLLIYLENIDISSEDLPRELDQIHAKLLKYESLLKALKIKDDMIWSLISEKKTQELNEVNYIREKSHNEIAGWAK